MLMVNPLRLLATEAVIDQLTPRTWYFLTIDPARPRQIAERLQRAKLWVYWPNFIRQHALRCGRRTAKQVSVLHGYLPLAVHASRQDTWRIVDEIPGIRGVLRNEQRQYASILESDIEKIREIEGRLNLAPQQAARASYPPGTPVRFVGEKQYTWTDATVIEVADDGRISVAVTLFNRNVPMWVDAVEIEAM